MAIFGDRVLCRIMPVPNWSSTGAWNQSGMVWGPAGAKETTKMNDHVSLGFKKKKDGDLIPFAQGVHDGVGGHATVFTTPTVTMAALLAAITDFIAKYNAANKGSVAQTEAKDAARGVLIGLLSLLAAYVEGIAQGNADTIRSAGFEPTSHDHHPQVTLAKPVIEQILNYASGQVQLRVTMQPNVHSVQVQYRTAGGAWQDGGGFPSSRLIVVVNLTPGTQYEFRVEFVGGSTNRSEWSDGVNHLCA